MTLVKSDRDFVSVVLVPLAEALRVIIPCVFTWQKAHDGCLFNELVDYIASWAAHDPAQVSQSFGLTPEDIQNLPWLWMHVLAALSSTACNFDEDVLTFPNLRP